MIFDKSKLLAVRLLHHCRAHIVGLDFMFSTTENHCSLSHLKGKISSCRTAWKASVEYEDDILSQKFIGEHSSCFVLAVCMVLCNCYLILQFLIKFILKLISSLYLTTIVDQSAICRCKL